MKSLNLSLFADYFQFYIQDEGVTGDLSQSWDEEATTRLLAVAPGTIGIGTARNMDVPVLVEICEQEPHDDLFEWGHAVEASLEVASGHLVIAGCTNHFPDTARIEVAPGCYHARLSFAELDSISEDRLKGDDHYWVQVWPSLPAGVRILKQRPR